MLSVSEIIENLKEKHDTDIINLYMDNANDIHELINYVSHIAYNEGYNDAKMLTQKICLNIKDKNEK